MAGQAGQAGQAPGGGGNVAAGRSPSHSELMDIPHLTRDAFTLLSTATALRKPGRIADAVATAERARGRLTDAVRAVDALLAEMRAGSDAPDDPRAEPEHVSG